MMKLKKNVLSAGLMLLAFLLFSQFGCKPDYPKCETDNHCADSEQGQAEGRLYCVNGLCQQCRADADCGDASLECNAGVCERIIGYCTAATDCPGNEKCRDNRCGPECLSNDECAADQLCQSGRCVQKPECTSDSDCGDDQMCSSSGKCVDRPQTVCQLSTVYFDYDSSVLDGSARSALTQNANCIKERNLSVRIAGHADERGTSEYNLALGERRASSVKGYLKQLGVSNSKMKTISYGEERLVRNCGEEGSESCHRENRRAEFSEQ